MNNTGDHLIPRSAREPIAVVGIGCRFPGQVTDARSFWRMLLDRTDAIADVPAERWNHSLYYHPEPGMPGKTVARQAGFISDIEHFDYAFFGISPREAAQMDPQHRVLLEVSWEALEDAGIPLEQLAGSGTAVFMGVSAHEYGLLQTIDSLDTHASTGQAACMVANRISYALNFRGPSIAVDTACSSALIAIHLACHSLWNGEAPLAFAGGVNLFVNPTTFVGFSNLSMLSPDSRCMAFDARANGFVRGEGAGVVVLKPLARALADGDRIYATILATASNQDGHSKGLTFPSQAAQEEILRAVYTGAGILPGQVSFIEAHGTGTQAGDPVEANAIGKILGSGRPAGQELLLASVKTNIGHLEPAAGIAGLIKACLALHHRLLPPNLHFEQPSPRIPFAELKLRVPVAAEVLSADAPLIAGVNSFGFGGSNAHAILGEAPAPAAEVSVPGAAPYLLPLSARTPAALQALATAYRDLLGRLAAEGDATDLGALCYTASARRTHHPHRLALVGQSAADLDGLLAAWLNGKNAAGIAAGRVMPEQRPRLAFLFSGQGSQWWAMGRELLEREPVFRAVVERCDRVVRELGDWSLLDQFATDQEGSKMHITSFAQPALFAVQAGLTDLWRSWGVLPDAVVGHSAGEIAAAYAAGVLSLEEGVLVAFQNGRLKAKIPATGRMLAVGLAEAEAARFLRGYEDRVAVAAVNSPLALTLSGEPEALEEIGRALKKEKIGSRYLNVNYAFHSPQMQPVVPELLAALGDLVPQRAAVRLLSTVSGDWSNGSEWNADYWCRNLRQTVRFAAAVDRLIAEDFSLFLEIGPMPALAGSVKDCLRQREADGTVVASLREGKSDAESLLQAVATLHTRGVAVAWEQLRAERRLVPLPAYPWQRERCWNEAEERRRERFVPPVHPLLGTEQIAPRPVWSHRLDHRLHGYLLDHRLQGSPVFPAAGYLEMALAAGRAVQLGEGQSLEEVIFESPCFLAEKEGIRLETRFSPDEARFEIFSRNPRSDSWLRHARGRSLPLGGSAPPAGEPLPLLAGRLGAEADSEALYLRFAALGLEYGAAFRGIRRLWRRDGEALGEVQLPPAVEGAAEYLLHPALLDACFQLILAALPPQRTETERAFLPVALDRLRLFRTPGMKVYGHVRIVAASTQALSADVRLLDEEGEVLLAIDALTCQPVESEAAGKSPLDGLLYQPEWRPLPLPATGTAPGAGGEENWLLFADGELAETFRAGLAAENRRLFLVAPGERYAAEGADRFTVDPRQPEGLRQLLADLAAAGNAPTAIVYAWGLAPAPATTLLSLAAQEEEVLLPVLPLLQTLAERPAWAPRLWLLTCRAQAVREEERAALAVTPAPLWGLRRVAAFELPRLRPAIVDLGDPQSPADIAALRRELEAEPGEDEIVLREGERYVYRYLRTTLADCVPPRVAPVAPGAQPFRIRTARLGNLDNLKPVAIPAAQPGAGEVVIEVRAAGLNFADVLKALGLYPGMTLENLTLGAECAGIVTAVGERPADPAFPAPPVRVGDRVVALAPHSFGSHVTTPWPYVFPLPAGLSFAQAAAIPIVYLTVVYGLNEVGRLRRGERILIHAATGGVGLAAIQVARRVGAEIFATAGTPEKREFLRTLGIEHVMDSRSLAFADEIMEMTAGEGVDIVLNSLAGEAIAKGLSVLRPFGRFIEIGKRDIYANSRIGLRPLRNNASFAVVDLDQAIRTRPTLVHDLFREVLAGFADGSFTPLPVQPFPVTELVEAFRSMSKAQHIGKIVISNEVAEVPVLFRREKPPVHPEATYLLTGGADGFCRAIALWLAGHGARRIVLANRSGDASPSAQAFVADLAALGCAAHVWSADVADPGQLQLLLARIARSLPPLRGVVHAAMVLDDGIIARLTPERFAAVTRPKVLGAWNLHQQTLDLPLDFFLLTSSISAVFGAPGQANYAAANAFLDALALYRRGLGLPALAVDLGPFSTVGHAARHPELTAYLANMGIPPMDPAESLAVLDKLLGGEMAQVGITRLDADRLAGGVMGRLLPPRFAELLAAGRGGETKKGADRQLLRALEEAPAAEREGLLLRALAQEMGRVLGGESGDFPVDRPLSDLGLDSLMTVEIITWVEQTLDLKLPTVELMRNPTTAELAHLLVTLLADKSAGRTSAVREETIDLRADALLDPAIVPQGGSAPETPAHLFLTGGTGFVGAFLIRELLQRTPATLHCLVRAADPEQGLARLRGAMQGYGIWEDSFARRIVPVPGDLEQPLFGLAPPLFAELAEAVEAIFHSGAIVNFLRPYAGMRAANVVGTQEVLRLACTGRTKMLHYISSIAVFSIAHYTGTVPENTFPHEIDGLPDGYSQSKWVAEQLVVAAMRQGLPVRIYRPGVLAGDSRTGVLPLNDALLQVFIACCRIGSFPDLGMRVDVTPVDRAVAAIVGIARQPETDAKIFHLCSPAPTPMSEFIAWLRTFGVNLELVPYERWREAMFARARDFQFEPLLPLLPESEAQALQRVGGKERRFSIDNTVHALAGSGNALVSLDRELVERYMVYLEEKHLLGMGKSGLLA